VMQKKKVCVIGKDIMRELFEGGVNPLGEKVSANGYSYVVVGTLRGIQPDEVSKSIFVPISLAGQHISHLRQLIQLFIRVDNYENVKFLKQQILLLLKESYPEYASGIRVLVHTHRLKRVEFIIFLIKVFIYAALVGIFLLGKVGLTNIMFSAVQERTREIGLRKAVGASDRMIRAQFILESVFVSVLAGVVGTLGGILSVHLLRGLLQVDISNYVMSVTIWLDISFTLAIGIAAGYYPSLQASRLDVVTAMRFE
jgi:putative ABC transport system permease protein